MRIGRAIPVFVGFVAIAAVSLFVAARFEDDDWVLISSMLIIVLGPVLVNAVELIRHQMALDSTPTSTQPGRQA
jgi:hypothetical protein